MRRRKSVYFNETIYENMGIGGKLPAKTRRDVLQVQLICDAARLFISCEVKHACQLHVGYTWIVAEFNSDRDTSRKDHLDQSRKDQDWSFLRFYLTIFQYFYLEFIT